MFSEQSRLRARGISWHSYSLITLLIFYIKLSYFHYIFQIQILFPYVKDETKTWLLSNYYVTKLSQVVVVCYNITPTDEAVVKYGSQPIGRFFAVLTYAVFGNRRI